MSNIHRLNKEDMRKLYGKMTSGQLRDILYNDGLDAHGDKHDLVERLVDYRPVRRTTGGQVRNSHVATQLRNDDWDVRSLIRTPPRSPVKTSPVKKSLKSANKSPRKSANKTPRKSAAKTPRKSAAKSPRKSEAKVKRGRGRPRTSPPKAPSTRGRGRPKSTSPKSPATRGRGRPKGSTSKSPRSPKKVLDGNKSPARSPGRPATGMSKKTLCGIVNRKYKEAVDNGKVLDVSNITANGKGMRRVFYNEKVIAARGIEPAKIVSDNFKAYKYVISCLSDEYDKYADQFLAQYGVGKLVLVKSPVGRPRSANKSPKKSTKSPKKSANNSPKKSTKSPNKSPKKSPKKSTKSPNKSPKKSPKKATKGAKKQVKRNRN